MKFLTENNREVNYYDRSKSWLKYKEKTKNRPKYHKVREEATYRKIIDTVLRVIRERWVNTTGGVYVRNMGYFAVYRTPHKTVSHRNYFSYVDRLDTDGYMYIPSHFTTLRNSDDFYGFNFNETFPHRMTQDLYKNIKAGRRYTLNYFLLKEYLKNRTNL
jgi:hypothetical protein